MPPLPMRERTLYGPRRCPTKESDCFSTSNSAPTSKAGDSIKLVACSSARSSASTSLRSASSPAQAASRKAARSLRGRSSTASNNWSIFCQRSGFIRLSLADRMAQPGFCLPPFALNRAGRHFQNLGHFFRSQPAKELHLNDPAFALIHSRQLPQRLIQRHQFRGPLLGRHRGLVQRHLLRPAATLGILAPSRVVHQDAPHQLRSDPEEVRPVLPVDTLLFDQPQVGFVDQGRGLQRVAGTLPPHVAARCRRNSPSTSGSSFSRAA